MAAKKEQTISDRVKTRRITEEEVEGIGKVRIGRLSAATVLHPEFTMRQGVLSCVLDEDGKPIFADEAALLELDWEVFRALSAKVAEVNRLDVVAAAKNSEAPPPDGAVRGG